MNRDIRQFLYFCLCDVYLESVKRVLNEPQQPEFDDTLQTLYICLTTGLRLLHPLMPFVTEELYQRINAAFDVTCSSISIEAYPTPNEVSWFDIPYYVKEKVINLHYEKYLSE